MKSLGAMDNLHTTQLLNVIPVVLNGGMVPVIWLLWTRNMVSFVMSSIPSGRFPTSWLLSGEEGVRNGPTLSSTQTEQVNNS